MKHQILRNGKHPTIEEVLKFGIDSIDTTVDEEYSWSELDYFFVFVFEGFEIYPIWLDVVESQTFGINHLLISILEVVVDENKDNIPNISGYKVMSIIADFDIDIITVCIEKPCV
ncbi:MAG: hypothetical protein Q4C34_07515 [Bacteroidales bacterium]|nr:hypothetical protein [Bacteroidales bacterium]